MKHNQHGVTIRLGKPRKMELNVEHVIRQCKALGQPATKGGARAAAKILEAKAGKSVTKLRKAEAIRFLAKFLPDD